MTSHSWGRALRVGGAGNDRVHGVAFGEVGDVYVIGDSTSRWALDDGCRYADRRTCGNAFLARLDAQGRVAWVKSFGGGEDAPGQNAPRHWAVMSTITYQPQSDLVVVQGVWAQPFGPGSQRTLFVAAFAPDGRRAWLTEFDEARTRTDAIGGKRMLATPDGGVVLAGTTRSDFDGHRHIGGHVNGATNGDDVFVCKLGADGKVAWSALYGVPDPGPYDAHNDYVQAMALDPAGNIHLFGGTHGDVVKHRRLWKWKQFHLRLSPAGKVLGAAYEATPSTVVAAAFAPDGSLYRLRLLPEDLADGDRWRRVDAGLGADDLGLEKLDARGKRLWGLRVGTDKRDSGTRVVVAPDGDIIVGGVADLYGDEDGLAYRFSPNGERRWAWRVAAEPRQGRGFFGRAQDEVRDVAVEPTHGVVAIAGSTSGDLYGNANVTQPDGVVPDDGFVLLLPGR
ncbi:MAG: hypothetical protein EP329_04315 [Deltaproteobacteria bacterium]|nr:MAG: hypothetical protein EP329_04315 [Deltaproteobacteria bacterium]